MFNQTIRALRLAGITPYSVGYFAYHPVFSWLEDLHNDPDGPHADEKRSYLKSSMTRFWRDLDEMIQC